MRRRLIGLLLATTAWVPAIAAPAVSDAPPFPLRPNLQTLDPYGFFIDDSGGHRHLRFGNEIVNRRTGVLELEPRAEDCNGDGDYDNDRTGYQRIYVDANGDRYFTRGVDTRSVARAAGCFFFHVVHDHWHFENIARYDLVGTDGRVVASNTKVSFCLVDSDHAYPNAAGSPSSPHFRLCGARLNQGISIGWADVYSPTTPGQELDIAGVPDGVYCFISTADPANQLLETAERDNSRTQALRIQGDGVEELSGGCRRP